MGTEQPENVTKSGDNFDLSTYRKQKGVEADGRPLRAYEVAAEMNVHPTQVSYLETGRERTVLGSIGRQAYIDAVDRLAARRAAAKRAAEGDAA